MLHTACTSVGRSLQSHKELGQCTGTVVSPVHVGYDEGLSLQWHRMDSHVPILHEEAGTLELSNSGMQGITKHLRWRP